METDSKATKRVVVDETEISPVSSKAHLPPAHPESPTIAPVEEINGSRPIQRWSKRQITNRPKYLCGLFFILGLSMSISHTVYYPKLKGRIVGTSSQQEQNLRFGTAFAFLAQICLGASVWTAYTQWMWRSVQIKAMTVAAWNAAFGADTSFLSLLNWEYLTKIKGCSAMALFAWSLLLPPFFTPATLFIYESVDKYDVIASMPYPNIANASAAHKFSYSPPIRRGTIQNLTDTSRRFAGSRTALNLIASATSSLGVILDLDLPYNDSSYSSHFFGPIVKCKDANGTEVDRIAAFLRAEMDTPGENSIETHNTYFSFVPTYNSSDQLVAASRPRQQSPSRSLNELWMTFIRAAFNESGDRVRVRHYQICRLYNASYSLSISQYHGVQNVSGTYTADPDPIPFPIDTPSAPSNMAQHAFAAFMWVMSDLLVGRLAWYQELSDTPTQVAAQYGIIDSPIQRTSLLGSRDLDTFFELDEEMKLYEDQKESDIFKLSDQRLKDKALAGNNRTLDVLIEELSFNLTVSLMHNNLLTDQVNTTITRTRDVNRYNYKKYGLFLPYLLANVFTFVCVALGMVSFYRDGVLPGRKVQDVIWASRNAGVHGRPSLSRRASMGARAHQRGDPEIMFGRDEEEAVEGRRESVFSAVRWRRGTRGEEGRGSVVPGQVGRSVRGGEGQEGARDEKRDGGGVIEDSYQGLGIEKNGNERREDTGRG